MTHSGILIAAFVADSSLAIPDGEPANELHMTLAYLLPDCGVNGYELANNVRQFASYFAPLEGRINATTVFENGDSRAFVALVDCPQLSSWRASLLNWASIRYLVDQDHGYTPHITLDYLELDEPMPGYDGIGRPIVFDTISVILNESGERFDFALTGDKEREMSLLEKAVNAVRDAIAPLLERKVKDVESWDGAASQWPDTDSYCKSCLIDVNEAAGRETKAQDHCALPVRGPGDGAGTYVRQAVHAAAGGRGISQVKRPSDVSEEDWASAVKQAANELIKAYDEMDEEPPKSVMDAAGKGRAVEWSKAYIAIMEMIAQTGMNPMDVYQDGGETFAVATLEGMLYKIPVQMLPDAPVLAPVEQWQRVAINFSPVEARVSVHRQADGRYRWLALACTAILNRSGEIDSRKLFDQFCEHIRDGQAKMPELDFYHLRGSDIGRADFVARDGYVLISSGLFDDDEIGRAAAEGIMAEPGYWGTSIMYRPITSDVLDIDGIKVRSFTDGVLLKISVLPETRAAALFTTLEVEKMDGGIKEALRKLLGRDDLVEQMEQRVDSVNERTVNDGLIARENEPAPEAQQEQATQAPEPAPAPAQEGQETAAIRNMLGRLAEIEANQKASIEAIKLISDTVILRLESLERSETERKRAWLADLPAQAQATEIFRPRQQTADAEDMPYNQRADMTMKNR